MIPFQPTYLEGLASRGWAFWLISGIKMFYGLTELPQTFSLPDAFPGAQRHIGNNQFDLASDLSDMYFSLSASAQAQFQEGLSLVLAELDFDRTEHYRLAQEAIRVVRRTRAKNILDTVPSLPAKIEINGTRPDLVAHARALQHEMLAGAVDLASATRASQGALVTISKNAKRGDFTMRELSSHLLRLCRAIPSLFETWFAIFSFAILASLRAEDGEASKAQVKEMRTDLIRVCGGWEVEHAIERMRGNPASHNSPISEVVTGEMWIDALSLASRLSPEAIPFSSPSARISLRGSSATPLSAATIAEVLHV